MPEFRGRRVARRPGGRGCRDQDSGAAGGPGGREARAAGGPGGQGAEAQGGRGREVQA